MAKEKQERYQLDPRTWLLLCLLGIASIILIHSEIGGLCIFLCCIFIHFFTGKASHAFSYLLCYLIFTGIAWVGVMLVENNAIFSVSSMLSSIGIIGRKAIIPLAFAACLAKEPTGSLMAALQAMSSAAAMLPGMPRVKSGNPSFLNLCYRDCIIKSFLNKNPHFSCHFGFYCTFFCSFIFFLRSRITFII